MTDDRLREAVNLAKEGNKFEARNLLDSILRDDPENADAWLVMAQVVEDRAQAIRCLRQVVRLRPGDERAKALLAKMDRSGTSSKANSAQKAAQSATITRTNLLPLIGGGLGVLLLIGLCAGGVILLTSGKGLSGLFGSQGSAAQVGPAMNATGAPMSTPRPRPTPTTVAFNLPLETVAMAETLRTVPIQPQDDGAWMLRTGLIDGVDSVSPTSYRVGTTKEFNVITGFGIEPIPFVLRYQNSVVDMWVEEGMPVSDAKLKNAADRFATQIYPTDRDIFGEEWSPGIDGNPRVAIMNTLFLGSNVAGYFSDIDEYPKSVYSFSNQQENFFMSLLYGEVGDDQYMSTLAHEFQHMIRFHTTPNEQNWADEGMAQLAERIAGYDTAFTHYDYLFDSGVSLNNWSINFRESYSHYGAGYLWFEYLWERLGTDFIRTMAHDPARGLQKSDNALSPMGITSDDVFADWIVANYVNNTEIADGRYGYNNEKLIPVCPRTRLAEAQTQRPQVSLPQYSANYIEIEGKGEFIVNFKGDPTVGLISSKPYSGQYMWWSNRENRSNTSLTREFDLTSVPNATLEYWAWWEMPDKRDAGYVEISIDGGQTWQFLDGKYTEINQQLADLGFPQGPHYTSSSGGGTHGLWQNENIDLTPYAGQVVQIRFEYITDTYFEGSGWAIDNIRIPEIGYLYDAEQGDDGWVADGWVRTTNSVPQNWTVSTVHYDGGSPSVEKLAINPDGSTTTTITLTSDVRHATVIVGAMARVTNIDATYHLNIGGTGKMDSLRNPPGVLLQDNFSSPCSTFYSFVLPDYKFGYQDGKYEIKIDVKETPILAWARQNFSNVVIDVDTVQVASQPDSITGVVCRLEDNGDFYAFHIRNDGQFQIIKATNYFGELLQDWTPSDKINTGDGAVNHLRVMCNDNLLMFNINGSMVATVNDDSLQKGDIAFYAATDQNKGIVVDFDNLVVTKP